MIVNAYVILNMNTQTRRPQVRDLMDIPMGINKDKCIIFEMLQFKDTVVMHV